MEVDGFHIRVDLTGQNNKVEHYSIRWLLSGQQQYVYNIMQYEIYLVSDEQVFFWWSTVFLFFHGFSMIIPGQYLLEIYLLVSQLIKSPGTCQISLIYCSVTLTLSSKTLPLWNLYFHSPAVNTTSIVIQG